MSNERLRIDEYPELKLNLTIGKVVIMIFTLFIFFLTPAYYIQTNYLSPKQETAGQVAGATSDDQSIFNLNQIYISEEGGILLIVGILLFSFSLILIIFLLSDSSDNKRSSI